MSQICWVSWLLMVLLLASGAPCKVPSLSQWTKESMAYVPGEQAVVLLCATRGRMEHILGGAYQNLMETAPRGLKKAWILEALGPFLLKAVERLTSILCLHSSRTFHNISDWSFRSLVQFLPFEVTQNIPFCPSIHSFIHSFGTCRMPTLGQALSFVLGAQRGSHCISYTLRHLDLMTMSESWSLGDRPGPALGEGERAGMGLWPCASVPGFSRSLCSLSFSI